MTCPVGKFVLHLSLTLIDKAQKGWLLNAHQVPGGFPVSFRKQLHTFLIMKLRLDTLWCLSVLSVTSSGVRYRTVAISVYVEIIKCSSGLPIGVWFAKQSLDPAIWVWEA